MSSGTLAESSGELEITDLQMRYLSAKALHVERMGRGFAWLDTGTVESLIDAATFVQTLEKRQGMKVACPEEIAFRQGFIDRGQVEAAARPLEKSGYGKYLNEVPISTDETGTTNRPVGSFGPFNS